jgi:Domain of unknown function (DUF4404)
MDRQQLLDRLQELHAELHASSTIDAHKREHLRELAKDIEAKLDSQEVVTTRSDDGLISRLEEAALQLEASHPNTTLIIGKVVDLLVKMGI